jgi:hypothetical protein
MIMMAGTRNEMATGSAGSLSVIACRSAIMIEVAQYSRPGYR